MSKMWLHQLKLITSKMLGKTKRGGAKKQFFIGKITDFQKNQCFEEIFHCKRLCYEFFLLESLLKYSSTVVGEKFRTLVCYKRFGR